MTPFVLFCATYNFTLVLNTKKHPLAALVPWTLLYIVTSLRANPRGIVAPLGGMFLANVANDMFVFGKASNQKEAVKRHIIVFASALSIDYLISSALSDWVAIALMCFYALNDWNKDQTIGRVSVVLITPALFVYALSSDQGPHLFYYALAASGTLYALEYILFNDKRGILKPFFI